MTRDDIIELLRQHGHKDLVIGGGAAMVLHGIRDSTADIDTEAVPQLFDALWSKHRMPRRRISVSGMLWFTVPGTVVDVFEQDRKHATAAMAGVLGKVQTPKALLKVYGKSTRPKDQQWIAALARAATS